MHQKQPRTLYNNQFTTAHAPIYGESSHGPHLPCSTAPQWGGEEGEGQRELGPKAAYEQIKENNCRFLHRQQIRDSSDICLRPTLAKGQHGVPLHQHCPLWSKGPSAWRIESTHLTGTGPAQDWISRFLLQQLETYWAERKSCLTRSFSSSLSISSHTHYQGYSCQHTLRKNVTCIHIKSSSPTKGTRHTQSV